MNKKNLKKSNNENTFAINTTRDIAVMDIPAFMLELLMSLMHNTMEKTLLLIQGFESAPTYLTLTPKEEKVIDSVSTDKMPPVIFSGISLCWK